MIYFPDWSDLGQGSFDQQLRGTWDERLMMYDRWNYYYSGAVFREKIPMEHGSQDEAPLLYPVSINLVKTICLAQADTLFGEWEEYPIRFGVRADQTPTDADIAASRLLASVLETSHANTALWQVALDMQIYGGGVIGIAPDLSSRSHIRWSHVPVQSFFPVWDPDDPFNLLQAFIVTALTPEQALLKYGFETQRDYAVRIVEWTPKYYKTMIDQSVIGKYSGPNPWGIVPYVYIPRLRSSGWYGDSQADDVIGVQDEVNMRVADIGEAVNYNSHPVRWGFNLPRNFNAENYPLGSNVFWDLGRVIGNSPEPKVGVLEIKDPAPAGVANHIQFLLTWAKTSNFSPPVAFGDDEGGSQRSGDTLEIRLWPLLKATRRTRSYLSDGLAKALEITGLILLQKSFPDIPVRSVRSILEGRIVPQFARILPRDQQKAVDEVVKLLSTTPPSISLVTSQSILGRGPGEVDRIKEMLEDEDLFPEEPEENDIIKQEKSTVEQQKQGSQGEVDSP